MTSPFACCSGVPAEIGLRRSGEQLLCLGVSARRELLHSRVHWPSFLGIADLRPEELVHSPSASDVTGDTLELTVHLTTACSEEANGCKGSTSAIIRQRPWQPVGKSSGAVTQVLGKQAIRNVRSTAAGDSLSHDPSNFPSGIPRWCLHPGLDRTQVHSLLRAFQWQTFVDTAPWKEEAPVVPSDKAEGDDSVNKEKSLEADNNNDDNDNEGDSDSDKSSQSSDSESSNSDEKDGDGDDSDDDQGQNPDKPGVVATVEANRPQPKPADSGVESGVPNQGSPSCPSGDTAPSIPPSSNSGEFLFAGRAGTSTQHGFTLDAYADRLEMVAQEQLDHASCLDKKFYETGITFLQKMHQAVQDTGGVTNQFVEDLADLATEFLKEVKCFKSGLLSRDRKAIETQLTNAQEHIASLVKSAEELWDRYEEDSEQFPVVMEKIMDEVANYLEGAVRQDCAAFLHTGI